MPLPNSADIARQFERGDSKTRILALVALRQVPALEAEPILNQALADSDPKIRSLAVAHLGKYPIPQSCTLLVDLLGEAPDPGMRASAAGALGELQDPAAVAPLIKAFYEETEWVVRLSAAVALGDMQAPQAQLALYEALKGERGNRNNHLLQAAAIAALGEIGNPDALEYLLPFVASGYWPLRQRLAIALGNLPSPKTVSALQLLQKDDQPQVAAAAQQSLQKLSADEST